MLVVGMTRLLSYLQVLYERFGPTISILYYGRLMNYSIAVVQVVGTKY